MADNPSELSPSPVPRFVKVVCALGVVRHADMDVEPDFMTQAGTVQIVCDAGFLKYLATNGRGRLLDLEKETFIVRASDGELIDGNGQVGLYLLDPKADGIDPTAFTYTATIKSGLGTIWTVTFGGSTTLPDTLDLVTLVSSSKSGGVSSTLDQRVAGLESEVETI